MRKQSKMKPGFLRQEPGRMLMLLVVVMRVFLLLLMMLLPVLVMVVSKLLSVLRPLFFFSY